MHAVPVCFKVSRQKGLKVQNGNESIMTAIGDADNKLKMYIAHFNRDIVQRRKIDEVMAGVLAVPWRGRKMSSKFISRKCNKYSIVRKALCFTGKGGYPDRAPASSNETIEGRIRKILLTLVETTVVCQCLLSTLFYWRTIRQKEYFNICIRFGTGSCAYRVTGIRGHLVYQGHCAVLQKGLGESYVLVDK